MQPFLQQAYGSIQVWLNVTKAYISQPKRFSWKWTSIERGVRGLDSENSCLMFFQAIEGFALMVKRTAQALQSFGTELAETELPNEIQATTILLSTHTNKRDKMKVTALPSFAVFAFHFFSFYFSVLQLLLISNVFLYVCVYRRTCWWLWVRGADFSRASMNP